MRDLEIPLGKRTKLYRFLEMLPGVLSYVAVIFAIAGMLIGVGGSLSAISKFLQV